MRHNMTLSDALGARATRELVEVIGKGISFDILVSECLAADPTKWSIIDHPDFQAAIFATNDKNKIALLAAFAHPGSGKTQELFLQDELVKFYVLNQRIFHPNDRAGVWKEIIGAEFNSLGNGNYVGPLAAGFAKNPAADRSLLAEIIAGDCPTIAVSVMQRWELGRLCLKARYIDDSYPMQDTPTQNELDFDKPIEALFELFLDCLDKEKEALPDDFLSKACDDIPKLWDEYCFGQKFWRKKLREPIFTRENTINYGISWVESKSNYIRLLPETRDEALTGLALAFTAMKLLRRAEFASSSEDFYNGLIDRCRKTEVWTLRAAFYAVEYTRLSKKIQDVDEIIREVAVGNCDPKFAQEQDKKLLAEIQKIDFSGDKNCCARARLLVPVFGKNLHTTIAKSRQSNLDERLGGLFFGAHLGELYNYINFPPQDCEYSNRFEARVKAGRGARQATDVEMVSSIERKISEFQIEVRRAREDALTQNLVITAWIFICFIAGIIFK
ncbi:MAG: hypothetical protein EBU96_06815 [Actinobacteria bacterium]|nr:hypothetical protein [Actinomycetota bacterium]